MLLNRVRRGRGFFRTLFYLPALAPPVAATLAFVFLLKPGTGPVNTLLGALGIDGPLWFNSPDWAKPSLVLLGTVGRRRPDDDLPGGAAGRAAPSCTRRPRSTAPNAWQRFRYVTLPTISPVLLFAAVTGVIATLQYFTQAAVAASVASGGRPPRGGGISSTFGYPEGSTFTYPLLALRGRLPLQRARATPTRWPSCCSSWRSRHRVLLRRFRAFAGGAS